MSTANFQPKLPNEGIIIAGIVTIIALILIFSIAHFILMLL